MSEEQTPPGLTPEDWAATPLAVQQLVLSLLETVAVLHKRVAELEERVNQTLEQAVSVAVAQPVADAHIAMQTQPVANIDETSWLEEGGIAAGCGRPLRRW